MESSSVSRARISIIVCPALPVVRTPKTGLLFDSLRVDRHCTPHHNLFLVNLLRLIGEDKGCRVSEVHSAPLQKPPLDFLSLRSHLEGLFVLVVPVCSKSGVGR